MSWRLRDPNLLVAYYPMNNHVRDIMRTNNASWTGSEGYVDGPLNDHSVADFDGANDNLQITSADQIEFGSGDFSISIWFRTSDAAGGIYQKGADTAATAGWKLVIDAGNLIFFIRDGTNSVSVTATISPDDGVLHNSICTRAGGEAVMYIDGKYNNSASGTCASVTNTGKDLAVADNNGGTFKLDSQIWGFRIYSFTTTAQEAKALHRMDRRI